MIIGLTGLKGSGKDTVGAYLVKNHNFERRSFAEPLKRSFAALFDIPMWEIENWKNDDSVFVTVGNKNNNPEGLIKNFTLPNGTDFVRPDHMWSPIRELSFREALQRYGTESHRDVFGENFWVDQALPVEGFYDGRAIVVTDVRFQSEAQRIDELGGCIIKIIRPETQVQSDLHVSEVEQFNIKADYQITNNGTIDDLYSAIQEILNDITEANNKWPGER